MLSVSICTLETVPQPAGIASLPTPFTETESNVTPVTVYFRSPASMDALPVAVAVIVVFFSATVKSGEPETLPAFTPAAFPISVMEVFSGSSVAVNFTFAISTAVLLLKVYAVLA